MALIRNGNIQELGPNEVFVFGSNLAGRHGKGAAALARKKWGAEYGVGRGLRGQSYAIPTKDGQLETRPLYKIKEEMILFRNHALRHPKVTFYLTAVGTGLADINIEVMKDLVIKFKMPDNVIPWWRWDGSQEADLDQQTTLAF